MSSLGRKMARNAAKRKATEKKSWNGLTSSFSGRDDLRAAMAGSQHRPTAYRDRSAEAARQISDAMTRARTGGYGEDGSYTTPEGAHMSKAYLDNLQTDKPIGELKGEKGGNCNRSACQAPGAYWYNHSTQKYYCETCADVLNKDRFNAADAARLYGHPLCTLDPDFASKARKGNLTDLDLV